MTMTLDARAYVGAAALLAAHVAAADYCEVADVTGDGAVTVEDAVLEAQCVAEIDRPWLPGCDLSGDYWSDAIDVGYVILAIPLCQGWAVMEEVCGEAEVVLPPYQPANHPASFAGNGWAVNFGRAKIGFDGQPLTPDCSPYTGVCSIEVTVHFFAAGWQTARLAPGESLEVAEHLYAPGYLPTGTPPITVTVDAVELQGDVIWVEWCALTEP